MNTFLKKTGISVASAAMLLTVVPNAFAAGSLQVTVSGNGVKSSNVVKVASKTVNKVSQVNVLGVSNAQSAVSSTGGNKISGTTGEGGEVKIKTGNATSTNVVTVAAGSNTYVGNTCGCESGDTTVSISGNGVRSATFVGLFSTVINGTSQSSLTEVMSLQEALSATGNNTIKNSTGSTDNSIVTGDATTGNTVVVESGNNVAGSVEIL